MGLAQGLTCSSQVGDHGKHGFRSFKMANLTDKLRREHAAITEALQTVNELGIGTKEGTAVLLGAKHLLLNHLAREDRELYPVLRRAAAARPEVHRMLEHFATEMEAVSATALAFFAKYEHGGEGLAFGSDFGQLMARLAARMSREENRLYLLFDKLERGIGQDPKS